MMRIKPYKINKDNYDNGNKNTVKLSYCTVPKDLLSFLHTFTSPFVLCFLYSELLIPFVFPPYLAYLSPFHVSFTSYLHPICLFLEFFLFLSLLSCQMFYSFFSPLIDFIFLLFHLFTVLLFCSRFSFTHNIFHLHISCSVL